MLDCDAVTIARHDRVTAILQDDNGILRKLLPTKAIAMWIEVEIAAIGLYFK
ncbi:MAG: hypothetical protein AB4290_20100 [Spirulina sp.]